MNKIESLFTITDGKNFDTHFDIFFGSHTVGPQDGMNGFYSLRLDWHLFEQEHQTSQSIHPVLPPRMLLLMLLLLDEMMSEHLFQN